MLKVDLVVFIDHYLSDLGKLRNFHFLGIFRCSIQSRSVPGLRSGYTPSIILSGTPARLTRFVNILATDLNTKARDYHEES